MTLQPYGSQNVTLASGRVNRPDRVRLKKSRKLKGAHNFMPHRYAEQRGCCIQTLALETKKGLGIESQGPEYD
jgi:hypothetical protein